MERRRGPAGGPVAELQVAGDVAVEGVVVVGVLVVLVVGEELGPAGRGEHVALIIVAVVVVVVAVAVVIHLLVLLADVGHLHLLGLVVGDGLHLVAGGGNNEGK
jgi:uncharacterized membrane protein